MDTTGRAIEAVWRIEAPKIIATLTRLVGDVGLAEELTQDALVVALERWPADGVPANPAGWLTSTAKHRAVDALRRRGAYAAKLAEIGRDQVEAVDDEDEWAQRLDGRIEDDLLRLIFMACHPQLTTETRVALTLRLLGGLSTAEIARALLISEATAGQRISRGKKTLAAIGVLGEVETKERLPSVLEVTYLIFNEGYAATAGDDWMRPALGAEALRLGRVLVGLLPAEPEVHGLVALMELQASRTRARTAPDGAPVLLPDQDRRLWDRLLIRRGLAALERAQELGGAFGPYVLQAAIAACHARAATADETDWPEIAAIYQVLASVSPSPVVTLNQAVAVGMAEGPAAGLALLDGVTLDGYALLPAVRGDLLARLGRHDEARAAFRLAAELTRNGAEREIFLSRASAGAGADL
ncbi:RNA polymerase sigma factor [Hamadaea tsunoensis]|uniref:RNA polymerase sigma factor n=1 Tax=Hamadaea tsunoensis TaxID=53368 RepID=UPI0003F8BA0D|nr:RNA polymerase sigma factor [Hamadaea tsunoensis]